MQKIVEESAEDTQNILSMMAKDIEAREKYGRRMDKVLLDKVHVSKTGRKWSPRLAAEGMCLVIGLEVMRMRDNREGGMANGPNEDAGPKEQVREQLHNRTETGNANMIVYALYPPNGTV